MDSKTAIANIKKLLFGSEAPPAVDPSAAPAAAAETPKEYSLADGGIVHIDKLEAGGIVSIADGAGNMTPAAAGTITLADGTTVAIGESGAIQSVTAPATEAPTAEAEMGTQAFMDQVVAKFATGTPEERIANLELMTKALMAYSFGWKISEAEVKAIESSAIAAYQNLKTVPAAMAAQFAAIQKENETLKTGFTTLLDIVEKLANEPAEAPSSKSKEAFASDAEDPLELGAGIRAILKNKNN